MASPTPKSATYASIADKRVPYNAMARQSSWDSVHALTNSMQKMNVRSQNTAGGTPSRPQTHRRNSGSSSSSSSAPIVTPIPSKDTDSSNPYPQTQTPTQHVQSPHVPHQSQHVSQGYQYRSPNGPVTLSKPDEILQVDYNLQPRHFINGTMGSTPPSNAATNQDPNATSNRSAINGNASPFIPQNGFQNSNPYGQPRGYAANAHQGNQSGAVATGPAGAGSGAGSSTSAADNKAAQDIAAQIALNSALQGLNAPLHAQQGQSQGGTGAGAAAGAGAGAGQIGQPPPLNQAALAAAAAYNPNLIPGLYGNPLYASSGSGANSVPGANTGAAPFYPGQTDIATAAAVANAVAALPPGAFQAALQNVGLGTYPLNPGMGVPGLPGVGLGVGVPGVGSIPGVGAIPGVGVPGLGIGTGIPGNVPGVVPGQQGGPSANNRKTSLYKTELCRSWEEKGSCRYGPKCQFAHGEEELKKVQRHPKYKTEICRTFWLSGSCPYGKRCCFIHTELPTGEGAEKKEGEQVPPTATPSVPPQASRDWEKDRAQMSSAASDSEQQQTSMLARIRNNPPQAQAVKTPSPPHAHQNAGHGVNGHGAIGSSMPSSASPGAIGAPGSGRPTLTALRVDTKSLNDQTVPKNSYPYTSNPAMPAPGLSLATDVVRGRLSPVPATAGADFGRHAAARMEVVGVSPQSSQPTPQATNPPTRPGGHLRSVSQTFPTGGISGAIEPKGSGRISPISNVHTRADSWGASALIGPASAVEGRGTFGDRKW